MDRHNHYECAFAAFARWKGLLTLGVDEAQRCTLDSVPLKSPDFLILGQQDLHLAVDVKGRRYPGGPPTKRRYVWENWATQEDVTGLARWAVLLGSGYQGLLVFVYHILPEVCLPEETPDLWCHQDRHYLFRAVAVDEYRERMKVRSPRWGTVSLSTRDYSHLVAPFSAFVGAPDEEMANAPDWESEWVA